MQAYIIGNKWGLSLSLSKNWCLFSEESSNLVDFYEAAATFLNETTTSFCCSPHFKFVNTFLSIYCQLKLVFFLAKLLSPVAWGFPVRVSAAQSVPDSVLQVLSRLGCVGGGNNGQRWIYLTRCVQWTVWWLQAQLGGRGWGRRQWHWGSQDQEDVSISQSTFLGKWFIHANFLLQDFHT